MIRGDAMLKSPHPVEDVGSGTSSRLDRGAQLRESKERWIQKTYKTSAQIRENKKQRPCTAIPRSKKPTKTAVAWLGFYLNAASRPGRVDGGGAARRENYKRSACRSNPARCYGGGIESRIPCCRQSVRTKAGWGREAQRNVSLALAGEVPWHGVERRTGADPLTTEGARRRDADDRRDSRVETATSGACAGKP